MERDYLSEVKFPHLQNLKIYIYLDYNFHYMYFFVLIVLQVKDGDTVIEEKEVTAYDNWSATFTVPKYDENADEKSYSVDELETPQFYKKEISGNTITNTFYVPEETIEIEAIKIWDDNDNEAEKRLETITFQLKNGNTIVKEQKVTETDEWTYTFTNLPKYDENADEIKYTLDELETSEFYIKTISEYTITNKFVVPGAQKEISGQKIWDDYNNSYHTRPESVTIEVYGNGELVTEYVISSENDWKFDIKLDLYDDYGNEIVYSPLWMWNEFSRQLKHEMRFFFWRNSDHTFHDEPLPYSILFEIYSVQKG